MNEGDLELLKALIKKTDTIWDAIQHLQEITTAMQKQIVELSKIILSIQNMRP